MCWGLDASLELKDHVALVLDIHHHYIRDEEYILPTDDRFKQVIDSWRGVRPAMHYSLSREDLIGWHDVNVRPDMHKLLEQGYKKQKLRAHSDYMWNNACNDWALSFLPYADIMTESKCKNLSSISLYNHAVESGVIQENAYTHRELDSSASVACHAETLPI
jgi:UV DNA damage repair endonuclease